MPDIMNEYWGTSIDEVVDYFGGMGALKAETYVPYFLCSYATHVANLKNKKDGLKFYCDLGRISDLRLHLLFVSPPGFMKSYWLDLLLNETYGLLAQCGLPTRFWSKISEAGLVGSVRMDRSGVAKRISGEAELFDTAVCGCEEASNLFTPRNDYNVDMLNTLLTLLDTGYVVKRLAEGSTEYMTYLTLWAGTQIGRLYTKSGIGRRFMMLLFMPTKRDIEDFKKSVMDGANIAPGYERIDIIRSMLKPLVDGFDVGEIIYDDEVKEFLLSLEAPHHELSLYQRLIIGYNLLCNYEPGDRGVSVALDNRLKGMVREASDMRLRLQKRPEMEMILTLMGDNDWFYTSLKDEAIKYLGFESVELESTLTNMVMLGLVEKVADRGVRNRRRYKIRRVEKCTEIAT